MKKQKTTLSIHGGFVNATVPKELLKVLQ